MKAVAELFSRGGPLDVRRAKVFARARIRGGVRRVKGSWKPVLSASFGVAASWVLAQLLLNQPMPLFASIACWICLGFTKNRTPRTVLELGVGSAVGVGIGEVFATLFGTGPLQLGAVLLVATLFGRFLDRGDTFTFQSASNGLVIVAMAAYPTMPGMSAGSRWADALIGAAVAFVITVVLPRNISERPTRYARAALAELAQALEMLGKSIKHKDMEGILDVGAQCRAVTEAVDDWHKALKSATDIFEINPIMRSEGPQITELNRLYKLAVRAETSLRMLQRQSIGFFEQTGEIPEVGELLTEVASATRSLAVSVGGWYRPIRAREVLLQVAAHSAPSDIDTEDWRPAALMSLLRALVVDLLQMTGMSRADSNAKLAETHGAPFAVEESVRVEDEKSEMWGN